MKAKCIAIIPARGGSKGIQRKNVRQLNGKPLIAYSIEKALQSSMFSDVIVSTDDDEIAYVAQQWGAAVMDRPAKLAADNVGLDEVIHYTVNAYEKLNGVKVQTVATLQPTSPLLGIDTIKKAVKKCIHEGYDTVLTAISDAHLGWKLKGKNRYVPDYKKRLNRQYLPKHFRETGGIVVCKRTVLNKKTRFGRRIGIVECDSREAVDIDDRFDWWITEKQMKRKCIIFRLEGYDIIGLGHVYRCLTLADNMLDHDITFVISDKSRIAINLIRSRFYPVVTFMPGFANELKAIDSCSPDIVVNDILDTNRRYISALKKRGYRVVNFEDLGSGIKQADAVINGIYDDKAKGRRTAIFSGPDYICLRDEFYLSKNIRVKKDVENVLILFGGTDSKDLTLKALKWLLKLKQHFSVTIIIGAGYSHKKRLTRFVNTARKQSVKIISNTKIIAKYMQQADIAITSAGRTVFELASMGIPMIVMSQNTREDIHSFARKEPGVIFLGRGHNLPFDKFQRVMLDLVHSQAKRRKMHKSLLKHDLKKGIKRVWNIILNH